MWLAALSALRDPERSDAEILGVQDALSPASGRVRACQSLSGFPKSSDVLEQLENNLGSDTSSVVASLPDEGGLISSSGR